jgi:hypothetical protein
LIWPDGKKYVGGWKAGKQHGEGEFTKTGSEGTIVKKGLWQSGTNIQWYN